MTKQTDILIIGGGIAGLTLALLLGKIKVPTILVEPRPPAAFDDTKINGRSVALMQSSLNILKATHVWDRIKALSNPLKTMRIIDNNTPNKPAIDSAFNACDLNMDHYGYNIPNNHLRAALYEMAQAEKFITIINQGFTHLEHTQNHITATLDNEERITARLIIGADGRNSPVREAANIKSVKTPYNQKAITCIINHSRPHNDSATEFHRPAGPLAFVPMPGHQSSIVWVETPARADEVLKLKKTDFTQTLEELSNNFLGGVTLEIGPQAWPLCTIKAKSLTAPRVALMAEAAHVMSPITAQGLNLSLRDVGALAEIIADSMRLGIDPGSASVLNSYERRRRIDIGTRVFGVDRMNKIVSTDLGMIKDLRRTALKTVEKIPPLKRFAMRQGLAPQMDLGRLARGEAL